MSRFQFPGGIHPKAYKVTQDLPIVPLPIPEQVIIPLKQGAGEPCVSLVKKGDQVYVGQKIGGTVDQLSCPVHSSVSGTVRSVGPMPAATGSHVDSVVIDTDGEQTVDPSVSPPTAATNEEKLQALRESGLVGLGGAGFPTWYKLQPFPGQPFDSFLVNAAECEPYISSDYLEMMENAEGIVRGIKWVLEVCGIPRAYIGIEDNKPLAIQRMTEACAGDDRIDVVTLRTKYPQGGERQLIYSILGRRVRIGTYPSSVGCVVLNVSTVAYIDEFWRTGMPLNQRRISVVGDCIANPKNLWVPVGSSLEDVVEFCGGFSEHPAKVIMGGPMMGVSQFDLSNSILKFTNNILALSTKQINTVEESVCIRCAKCVAACPMKLMPNEMHEQIMLGNIDEAFDRYHLKDCIECGSCSYVCPAAIHLVQSFKFGKAEAGARHKAGVIANGSAPVAEKGEQ